MKACPIRSLCLPSLRICLYFLGLAFSSVLPAQTVGTASPPTEAQEAISKGVIAAQAQDYLLAIRYFQDARKASPDAPLIFLNLGLAESKIPGRELRAIAWFAAYLAADPQSTKAPAVKEQIDRLIVISNNNLSQLMKTVQDAASNPLISDTSLLNEVCNMWLASDDFGGALKCADLIRDETKRSEAWEDIGKAQARAGDIEGAKKTAGLIRFLEPLSNAQVVIAVAQAKAGDFESARTTVTSTLKNVDLMQDPYFKAFILKDIASAQMVSGDIAGARHTFMSALKCADLIQGDGASAKSIVQAQIAEAQAMSGDLDGARKTIARIKDAGYKHSAQEEVARFQEVGPTQQVSVRPSFSDWLSKLDDAKDKYPYYGDYECPLNTAPFLNLAGTLTSSEPDAMFRNPYDETERLRIVTLKITIARNFVYDMLKRQSLTLQNKSPISQ